MARPPFTDRLISMATDAAREFAGSIVRSAIGTSRSRGRSGGVGGVRTPGTVAQPDRGRGPTKTRPTGGMGTRAGAGSHPGKAGAGSHRGTAHAGGDERAYYRDPRAALPKFSYQPRANDEPDPGEVVWTWVPYEEDDSQGKDRPVLVLAYGREGVVAAQLTTQNHHLDAAQEAHWGRYWMDIGTGDWDRQGRPSQVRLDRLLVIPAHAMRREGGRLDERTFARVCEQIVKAHRG